MIIDRSKILLFSYLYRRIKENLILYAINYFDG